jgi:uncharacterized protein
VSAPHPSTPRIHNPRLTLQFSWVVSLHPCWSRILRYNTTVTLLFNIVMLAVDIGAILLLRRYRGLLAWLAVIGCAGGVGAVFGGALACMFEDHFGLMRLCCYCLFLHGPVLLTATAVLWRPTRRQLARLALLGAISLVAVAVDAFLIEPHWLEISHRQIVSPKIHRPMRIVVLADLQTDSIGAYERRVLQQALDEKPDIILFAGDYFQADWDKKPALQRELHDLLREMQFSAPRGTFAVRGNCDSPYWNETFDGLDVEIVNTSQSFDLGDLQLTCLGLYDSYNPSLVVNNNAPNRFHLVLGHVPNYAMGKVEADLLLAGHTHGGQIRLPFVGAMITNCAISRSWAAGVTALPSGGKLLVSRGLGMERGYAPRIRFLCRPELLVIDLVPEEKSQP